MNSRIKPTVFRRLWSVALFLIVIMPVSAQEEGDVFTETVPETETDEVAEPQEDKRELTLLYGIDSEVLSVLSELRQDALGNYNELLLEVLRDSRNGEIDQAIYGLWAITKWDGGLETAGNEIKKVLEDEDYELNVVQSAIAYIADREYKEALADLGELSGSRETRLAASAVRAIGKIGEPEDISATDVGDKLLERLKKEDPVAEDDLVASIIITLGNLGFEAAAPELVMIAEDEGAPAGHRRMACISIGKIGRNEDYPIIERLYYESSDATLRSYALAGLAEFEGQDTTDILIQALKRDSFWRIRQTAAEKLGEEAIAEAADLLRYKAVHDPVNHVRIASMKALGIIADPESRQFLLDYFIDELKGTDVRLAALSVLVENQIGGTSDAVMEVMDKLWDKDQGRFLEFTCRDLSRGEWDALASVYERMLNHDNWLLQVYGIRGIRRNSLTSLKPKVDALDSEGVDGRVRREVNLEE